MTNAEQGADVAGRAKLRNSTTVLLVGNIEPTMEWYKPLGFKSEYYPPGFAILSRDEIQIFLQQQAGYVAPDDRGRRERHAWNVYIITDDVKALYEEYSALPGVKISRQLWGIERAGPNGGRSHGRCEWKGRRSVGRASPCRSQ